MTETIISDPLPGFRKGRKCKRCGCEVSDRGRNSKTGDYFCSKRLCRLQRDAERQQRYRDAQDPAAASAPTRDELRQRMLDEGMPLDQVNRILPPGGWQFGHLYD